MTADTERETPQRRTNLVILAITAFLRGAHTTAYNVILQPFLLSLGASMPTVGLLNSLGGVNGIVTTLVQPLGGWLADRLGRKPFIIASSAAILIAYAFFWFAGALGVWALVLLGVIGVGVAALSLPARSSMTAESVRARHGTAFSAMLVAGLVPGVIMPALAGALADRVGYESLFLAGAAIETTALVLAWRYLYETRAPDQGVVAWRATGRVVFRAILPPPELAGFFVAVAGDAFVWGIGWGLLYGMLTETYHFTAEQLGIMASVSALSWALMQMPIGRYIDGSKIKGMMIISEAIGVPLMFVWLTQSRFEAYAAAQVLFAATAATWTPTVSTYLTRQVSAAERGEAFGRLYMFRGVVAFPAPAIGGILYAWGGMQAPIVANLIGILVLIGVLIWFVPEPQTAAPDSQLPDRAGVGIRRD